MKCFLHIHVTCVYKSQKSILLENVQICTRMLTNLNQIKVVVKTWEMLTFKSIPIEIVRNIFNTITITLLRFAYISQSKHVAEASTWQILDFDLYRKVATMRNNVFGVTTDTTWEYLTFLLIMRGCVVLHGYLSLIRRPKNTLLTTLGVRWPLRGQGGSHQRFKGIAYFLSFFMNYDYPLHFLLPSGQVTPQPVA